MRFAAAQRERDLLGDDQAACQLEALFQAHTVYALASPAPGGGPRERWA